MTLSGIVLDSSDARALAAFYRRLLGWTAEQDEPEWVTLRPPGGGAGLSFQTEAAYAKPTWPAGPGDQQMMVHLDIEVDDLDAWPAGPGDQQMMVHLDIEVDDLDAAGAHAVAAGAVLAQYQPQENVRVYLDPAGHPFCLWVRS
jgi:predicted enzyme related to lactoylglutathione lyase